MRNKMIGWYVYTGIPVISARFDTRTNLGRAPRYRVAQAGSTIRHKSVIGGGAYYCTCKEGDLQLHEGTPEAEGLMLIGVIAGLLSLSPSRTGSGRLRRRRRTPLCLDTSPLACQVRAASASPCHLLPGLPLACADFGSLLISHVSGFLLPTAVPPSSGSRYPRREGVIGTIRDIIRVKFEANVET